MKRKPSPCINICDYSGPKGWCLGCGRTRQESKNWSSIKPYDKNFLLKELDKRMRKIKATTTD
ncbi:MAG: DUF1289 domain-containing protein [Pseudomonadales bacterium]